jgi:predicted  nucleic acid-binding Zn-ribbon protein
MGKTLDALRDLQDIELQIVDIRRQLAAKQRSVKRQQDKVRTAEEAFQAAEDEVRQSQMEMDALDLDLKSRNESVSKLRDNLNSVKTNKEYAAVLAQLNTQKADVTRLEARVYELMESLESKKGGLGELKQQVTDETARLQNLQGQFAQAETSFAQRLGDLKGQRDEAAAQLSPEALDLFERVSERYEGEVLAAVVRTHPRRDEFICDGCYMSLAAERANALMTRDEVITCDNCGRILHISESG